MRAYLAGLRADVLPPRVFFEPGSCARAGASDVVDVNDTVWIDPTGTGLGGRDRPRMFGEGQAVFFYLLDDGNGGIGGVCSPGYNYGDVILPAGCTFIRKLPFMCCWRSGWGGIPSFHYEGTQNPRIRLTYPYCIAVNLTNAANVPTSFNLSPYIPAAGGARLVLLRYLIRYATTRAGSVFVGPDASNLVQIGSNNPQVGLQYSGYLEVRCDSIGQIAYMVNVEGTLLDLTLEGWVVTEVTN